MRTSIILLGIFFLLGISSSDVLAKKKNKKEKQEAQIAAQTVPQTDMRAVTAQARIAALTVDDRRLFDSLSDEQKKSIMAGKVDIGFNEWMIQLAVGKPFYGTEHHPIYQDYEQVWLYTRDEVKQDRKETQIIDPQTNWPTIHRITTNNKCTVGDYFLLFDRGVVDKIVPETDRKIYGSCSMQTSEAFLPIVDGRPVEPK